VKIYVAGHKGLVGSAIVRAIEAEGNHTWIGQSRSELNLLDRKAVFEYLAREKPEAVVIATVPTPFSS
jgi:GDP-L-fucose synthase